MEPICACGTGSTCLVHPPLPSTPIYSATEGLYAHPATWAYPIYHGSQATQAPPGQYSGQSYYQQPYCPPQYQTSYSFYPQEFHSSSKRSADPPPYIAATKRRRLKATAPTQGSHQYDAAALQRAQAQQAAATLPPTYYTDAHYEQSTSRARAPRATDCWYFTVGTHLNRLPSSEEVATLCIADEQRMNNSAIDLRKPSAPRLRCTECLKLGIWRTWKNNDEGGVSYGIRSHLRKRHASAYRAACERIGYNLDGFDATEEVNEPVTPQAILKYLVEWFAEDDIPFNMLTHRGFQRFFSYIAQGNASAKDIPERHAVAEHVSKLCEEEKQRIKNEIKSAPGRISCTSDLWSDEAQRSFMCITIHFITSLKQMVDYLIAFQVIDGSHTGANLAETFFNVLNEYGLGMITLDNASNNDTLMAQLEEYMRNLGLSFDRYGNRLRCFPHVINIAVQSILKQVSNSADIFRSTQASAGIPIHPEYAAYLDSLLSNIISRCRTTIVALRHGLRRQGLQKTIRDGNRDHIFYTHKWVQDVWTEVQQNLHALELILDCETRWSSTRDMLDRFIYLYQAVSKYIASVPALSQYTISHKDLEVLQDIRTVLNAAHRTQELLSSDKTPTLSFALPLYHALIQRWKKLQVSMPALSHAIGVGISKIEEYLDKAKTSPAHVLAMALNLSIRYSWIEQHWSSEDAAKAKHLVEEHLLFCLEEQQARCRTASQEVIPAHRTSDAAAERLNHGYEAFLADEGDLRPASNYGTKYHPVPGVPSSSSGSITSPSPAPTHCHSTSPARSSSDVQALPSDPADVHARNQAIVKLEHEAFLEERVVSPQDLNGMSPIDFWQMKAGDLPLVYQLALNVLPAQASSVSSERVFSSSKMTCTQSRNRISASTVEALQILKHSLRQRPNVPLSAATRTLDFMAHHIDGAWGDSAVSTVPMDSD